MESEEAKLAWRKLIEAETAHKGHDTEGQGSPITEIVWQHYGKEYKKIWDTNHPESPSSTSAE